MKNSFALVVMTILLCPVSVYSFDIDCRDDSAALLTYFDSSSKNNQSISIKGMCDGPIAIRNLSGIRIEGSGKSAIRAGEGKPGLHLIRSDVELHNVSLLGNSGATLLLAQFGSLVQLDSITDALEGEKPLESFEPRILAMGNSNITVVNSEKLMVRVRASSYAKFGKNSKSMRLHLMDTSMAEADFSEFDDVELWGNAYFTAYKSKVRNLKIYSQSSVEVIATEVDGLDMGGTNLFGAYAKSTVNGPYRLAGTSIIVEIVGSEINNWLGVKSSSAQVEGINAVVDGKVFKDSNWHGEVVKQKNDTGTK